MIIVTFAAAAVSGVVNRPLLAFVRSVREYSILDSGLRKRTKLSSVASPLRFILFNFLPPAQIRSSSCLRAIRKIRSFFWFGRQRAKCAQYMCATAIANILIYLSMKMQKHTDDRDTSNSETCDAYNGELLNPVHFAYILSTRAHRRRRRCCRHHKRLRGTRVVSALHINIFAG